MKTKIIIICSFLIVGAATCYAQDTTKTTYHVPKAYWGNLGFGASSLGAFSGALYLNAQITNKLLITAGGQAETNDSNFIDFGPARQTNLGTANILIGSITKGQYALFTFSAGVSYVDLNTKNLTGFFSSTPSSSTDQYSVGVPLLVQGYWVIGQCLGFGGSLYANINTLQSTVGFTVNLAFGRMQTHKPRYKRILY
jgi:hypothetical protein